VDWEVVVVSGLRRVVVVVFAVCVSVLAVTGCGGGDAGGGVVVARVGGQSVTRGMLDHWVAIEAGISREPTELAYRAFAADAPGFAACVAYRRANGQAAESTSRLKRSCRGIYEAQRRHLLTVLITYAWVTQEAAAQHITTSSNEVETDFTRLKHELYPTEAAYQRFLKNTGTTAADEFLREKISILATKLYEKARHTKETTGSEHSYNELAKRWAAKTSCAPGYIIPNCKQYKGPEPPRAETIILI
jgi:hypothetical protein